MIIYIYIYKPFSIKVLVAKVNAMLRRNEEHDLVTSFNNGDLVIDYQSHKVEKKGKQCFLTKSEYIILTTLSKFPQKIFSRDDLIEIVFVDFHGYDRTIDVHIKNLRSKICSDTKNPEYIKTVRGFGYTFGGVSDED